MNRGNLVASFALLLAPAAAWAGLLKIDSTTAYAQYRDDDLSLQRPFFEFFKGSYASSREEFQLDANFAVTENPSASQRTFSLYALDGSVWAVPERTKISFGRSFFTHMTVRPRVMDSLAVEHFILEKSVRLGAYTGIERPPEDLTKERSKISGLSLGYVSPNVSPLTANLRLEHQAFEDVQRDRVKTSVNKPLSLAWSPELMLDAERDLKFNIWSRSEAGVDFYPNFKSTFGVRYQIYELDPLTQADDPIINVLAQGRTQAATIKGGYFLTRDLYASYLYARNSYLVQSGYTASGETHQLELSAALNNWARLNLVLYRINSYGGWVEGGRGGFGYKLNSSYEISYLGEYSRYKKITSSDRSAISNQLGLSYYMSSLLHLDVIGEWNSNNSSSQDQRFYLKLIYLAWKET
ncbi:MAG: hypothetical protein ACXVA9_03075 [Bdellovibrionales bacterium]